MIQVYSCGHETTIGFWKDDAWFRVASECPECMRRKNRLTVTISKGTKQMLIKRAQGGRNGKPSGIRTR